jgi:hypothetical protein
MAEHAQGGMWEVHGAHVALQARLAMYPEFNKGKLYAPQVPDVGFSLRD